MVGAIAILNVRLARQQGNLSKVEVEAHMTVQIVVVGVGKLGRAIMSAANRDADSLGAGGQNPDGGVRVVAGVDKRLVEQSEGAAIQVCGAPIYAGLHDVPQQFDVLVDASHAESLPAVLEYAVANKKPLLVAATGHSPQQLGALEEAAQQIPILRSSNLSVGVNVTRRLVEQAAKMLGDVDVEIVEAHHRMKVDAPSGTALTLAEAVRDATGTGRQFVYGRSPDTSGARGKEIGIHAVRGGTVVGEHTVTFLMDDELVEVRHVAQSRDVFGHGALRAVQFLERQPPGLYTMGDLLD